MVESFLPLKYLVPVRANLETNGEGFVLICFLFFLLDFLYAYFLIAFPLSDYSLSRILLPPLLLLTPAGEILLSLFLLRLYSFFSLSTGGFCAIMCNGQTIKRKVYFHYPSMKKPADCIDRANYQYYNLRAFWNHTIFIALLVEAVPHYRQVYSSRKVYFPLPRFISYHSFLLIVFYPRPGLPKSIYSKTIYLTLL